MTWRLSNPTPCTTHNRVGFAMSMAQVATVKSLITPMEGFPGTSRITSVRHLKAPETRKKVSGAFLLGFLRNPKVPHAQATAMRRGFFCSAPPPMDFRSPQSPGVHVSAPGPASPGIGISG